MPATPRARYPTVRRARVTLRCLIEDLGQEIPPAEVDLGDLGHPLLDEARRIAPTSPRGQKRVLSIDHPLVYRIRHSSQRGATWVDEDHGILWLLAVERREAGSDADAYQYFADLHRAGRLLPTSDDYLRDRVESVDRLRRAIRSDLEQVLREARSQTGQTRTALLASAVPLRILVRRTGGLEEIWVAVATRAADGQGIPAPLRDYVFATLEALVLCYS